MTMIRIVKPDAAGPEPYISADAARAKLEVLLAKNPTAIVMMAETGDEVETACVPNSWTLFHGMIQTMHSVLMSDPE
jgi:hypothetical protein